MKCRICEGSTTEVGVVRGHFRRRDFHLRRCPGCGYAFIADPLTDFAALYDEAYYHGRGADPYIDYVFELGHPGRTVRRAEWQGILEAVGHLVPLGPATRWLDYGCGNGGQVRHVRERTGCEVLGYETGWIAARAAQAGIPLVDEGQLAPLEGRFDVVTAIEVLEHVVDAVAVVRHVRRLLKPGGLFFSTTGNAAPFRHRLTAWSYVLPEIPVSFFEPQTLARLLGDNGFRTEYRGFLPGFRDIIRFKALKNLGLRRRRWSH